jgi:hypothetical protein
MIAQIIFWIAVTVITYNFNKSLNRDIFAHFKDID